MYGSENSSDGARSGVIVTADMHDVEAAVLKGRKDAVEAGVDEDRLDAELARERAAEIDVEAREVAAFAPMPNGG